MNKQAGFDTLAFCVKARKVLSPYFTKQQLDSMDYNELRKELKKLGLKAQ